MSAHNQRLTNGASFSRFCVSNKTDVVKDGEVGGQWRKYTFFFFLLVALYLQQVGVRKGGSLRSDRSDPLFSAGPNAPLTAPCVRTLLKESDL